MNALGRSSRTICPDRPKPPIVWLSSADLPEVLALEKQCFTGPWTMEQLQSGLRRKTFFLLGAKGHRGLLGYISLQILAPEMEILNLAVLQNHRRQGLGLRLAVHALEIGVEHGAEKCFLEVSAENRPAMRLYEQLGFITVGKRKEYYQGNNRNDRRMDAIIMTKELSPGT